ncbi:unnamed protein product [Symbiodinium sp. CCMP2456]|nr:unnamed protein product [Symbiodinium sp. CCMP2456]
MELVSEFLAAPADAGCLVMEFPTLPPKPVVFVPLLRRAGGVLAAIPIGAVDDTLLAAGLGGGPELLVGPSCQISAGLAEEDEEGVLRATGESTAVLVVDFSEEVVQHLSRYDPEWLVTLTGERMAFYSAAEEPDMDAPELREPGPKRKASTKPKRPTTSQLAEQMETMLSMLPALAQQVQEISSRQKALEVKASAPPSAPSAPGVMPAHRASFPIGPSPALPNPLGTLRGLVGNPPKVRAPVPPPPVPLASEQALLDEEVVQDPETGALVVPTSASPFEDAMLRQSQVLGTLVSHLVAQADSGDSSLGPTSGALLGTRGATKREKLQEQLAARTGGFFLQVSQQALRRLSPSEPAPLSREDLLTRRPLFTAYAERFGGFGHQRSLGIVFWLLSNIADTLAAGDVLGAEELVALSLVAVEQAAQDGGAWDIGYLLCLLEAWATTTLSYVREIDLIQSRRAETIGPACDSQASPTRFPKKPKDSSPA